MRTEARRWVSYWRHTAIRHAALARKTRKSWRQLSILMATLAVVLIVSSVMIAIGVGGVIGLAMSAPFCVGATILLHYMRDSWARSNDYSHQWLAMREDCLDIAKAWEGVLHDL